MSGRKAKAERSSVRSPGERAAGREFDSHVSHRVLRWCTCVLVCEVACVSLGMTRFETSQAVSSALSPVSVGAQNSYMTPQCSCVLKKCVFSW